MSRTKVNDIRYTISDRAIKSITTRISDIVRRAWRSQAAFTLVEVIVMATVTTVGLLAILVVADRALQTSDANESRVAATNLAREGVELVRAARDSNWQAHGRQVDAGIPAVNLQAWDCIVRTPDHSASVNPTTLKPDCDLPVLTANTNPVSYRAFPNIQNGVPYFEEQGSGTTKDAVYRICPGQSGAAPVYAPNPAAQTGDPCPGGGITFYRRVTVNRGKQDGGTYNLLVRSYVTWSDNKGSDVSVEEYLTDWRKF